MTGKEKTFFRICIKLVLCGQWTVKEVMDLVQDMISYDECIVYLRSWERLGLYTSTWMTYTGWFSGNLAQYPDEYRNIAEEYIRESIQVRKPNTRD